MKEKTNNEMDLLLRRLSRRQDAELRIHGEHLDADELSSYAENVLPAAARARYTDHLAECARCRELVVQLGSSMGAVSAASVAKASMPSTLRKFLASLFSPVVLRYAVPALGLVVVAVIGFAVLRQRSFSQRDTATRSPVEAPAVSNDRTAGLVAEKREQYSSPAPTPERQVNKPQQNQAAPPPNAPPSVSVSADVKQQEAQAKKAEEQPAANTASGVAAPKPVASVEKLQTADSVRAEVSGRVAPAANPPRERANEPTKADDRRVDEVSAAGSGPAKNEAEKAPKRAAVGGVAKIQRDGLADKDKEDVAVRSVSGRRFRNERGMWIDTAYEAPRATVNVSRGSEQYRALVADEPGIKTIADQLEGEIIVVWKGRAYRIH